MARNPGTAPWSRAARRCRTPPVRAGRAGGCGRGARLWRMAAFSTEPRRRRDGRAAGSLHAERKGRAGRAASRQAPRVASGHNARFRAGRYLRARQRLCVEAQCRYRRSRQDRTTPRGDHRPGSRLPSCSASKQSSASRGDDPANRSEPFACPGYLGARLGPGQSGLGDATAGRHRSIYASGAAACDTGGAEQRRGDAGPASIHKSAEDLSAGGRPVRWRRDPTQHRCRQSDHGQRDERHRNVHGGAERRDPRLGLCAARRRFRRETRHRCHHSRAGDAQSHLPRRGHAHRRRSPAGSSRWPTATTP